MIIKKHFRNFLSLLFAILILLSSCASTKPQLSSESAENDFITSIPTMGDMSNFLIGLQYLNQFETGKNVVNNNLVNQIYGSFSDSPSLIELLTMQFLLNTQNEDVKEQVRKYLLENKPDDDFSKCLEKKINAEKLTLSNGNIQYSYQGKEFDENINLFSISEFHPFKDEFGLLFFDNNPWAFITLKNSNDDTPSDEKYLGCMCGGGTNSLSITFREYENIKSLSDVNNAMNIQFVEGKYDNWVMYDLPLTGILESSGATKYYLGYGSGPDIFPEINCCTVKAFLYNEESGKLYETTFFMNYSCININYPIRDLMYYYLIFFGLSCYCE